MNLKRWLPLLGALGLMVTVVGVAEATNQQEHKTRTIYARVFLGRVQG